ncbi:MAG: hypothetical protein CM15mP79_1430 [Methanobacteriota archaeon]|nr:MAG: hypothetical protein CM15mP79_1430 [Euryarchaeota archaeon]
MAEPLGEVSDANALDPDALGFMCGIEVHQQLATGKLHSRQPGVLYDVTEETVPDTWPRTRRRLRAARGEGGAVDVAARFEAKRRRSFEYVQSPNAGLIELDERPPLPLDSDAVDVTLTVAALLEARPVDLMQTMRKTVVDGSNTSGFQRTTLVAQDGTLQTPEGPVGVDVICLEEDSARKLSTVDTDSGERVSYNLDRLGLPLIEIATAPDVQTPDHAQSTARALGAVLRRTRRVRRGLGSIRQDLNVSIACGDRVEIKGCQDLGWIPRIVRLEMARQLHFYRLANTLREAAGQDALPPDRRSDDPEREARVAEAVAARFPDVLNIPPFLLAPRAGPMRRCPAGRRIETTSPAWGGEGPADGLSPEPKSAGALFPRGIVHDQRDDPRDVNWATASSNILVSGPGRLRHPMLEHENAPTEFPVDLLPSEGRRVVAGA